MRERTGATLMANEKIIIDCPCGDKSKFDCKITVQSDIAGGLELFLEQGGHTIVLDLPGWKAVRSTADRALNFIGEMKARAEGQ